MKLDLGMHIGLHLVFFGKTGVKNRQDGLAMISSHWKDHTQEQKDTESREVQNLD
jgi:hypothetical protein